MDCKDILDGRALEAPADAWYHALFEATGFNGWLNRLDLELGIRMLPSGLYPKYPSVDDEDGFESYQAAFLRWFAGAVEEIVSRSNIPDVTLRAPLSVIAGKIAEWFDGQEFGTQPVAILCEIEAFAAEVSTSSAYVRRFMRRRRRLD